MPDLTAARLEIAPGLLPPGAATYAIGMTAAKGGRADADTTTVRVVAGEAPTGRVRWVTWG